MSAPVAQRIERRPPEPKARVRPTARSQGRSFRFLTEACVGWHILNFRVGYLFALPWPVDS
jgi:hypothetical protein